MQALVLDDDHDRQVATGVALFKRGFQVVTAGTVDHAMAYADLGVMDLVVMSERAGARLSHPVALAAELRNPDVTTMMLTPRVDRDVDELYELLPSLYCLLGAEVAPEMIARMAVTGVTGRAAACERDLLRHVAVETDVAEDVDFEFAADVEAEQVPDVAEVMQSRTDSLISEIMARAAGTLEQAPAGEVETAPVAHNGWVSRRDSAAAMVG